MCKRICKIFQMPTNHNEQAAKRNILDVVDGAVNNTYVKIILFINWAIIGSLVTSPRNESEISILSDSCSFVGCIFMWESCAGSSEDMTEPTNFSVFLFEDL